MAAESQVIIGRAKELADLGEFLGGIEAGPIALVLDGEMGIGKTALWKAGLAAADGSLVPRACLSADRVGGAAGVCGARGSAGRGFRRGDGGASRAAAAGARGGTAAERTRGRAVATCGGPGDIGGASCARARTSDRRRNRRRSVARSRVGERTCVRGSSLEGRPNRPADDPAKRRLDPRCPSISSGHSSTAARVSCRSGRSGRAELERLLAARLDGRLSEQSLAGIHDRSRGNPLFALEIGRAMLQRGDLRERGRRPDPGEPARARARPPRAPAATCPRGDGDRRGAVEAHADADHCGHGQPDSAAAIEAAATVGIVELEGDRVRFAHPLLASITYAQIPPARRRSLHARLAEILEDPEERGRHLALATERADAAVAAALDEAARRARARGAPASAAELWEAGAQADAGRRGSRRATPRCRGGRETFRCRRDRSRPRTPGGGRRRVDARPGAVAGPDTARMGLRPHRRLPCRRGDLPGRAGRTCRRHRTPHRDRGGTRVVPSPDTGHRRSRDPRSPRARARGVARRAGLVGRGALPRRLSRGAERRGNPLGDDRTCRRAGPLAGVGADLRSTRLDPRDASGMGGRAERRPARTSKRSTRPRSSRATSTRCRSSSSTSPASSS